MTAELSTYRVPPEKEAAYLRLRKRGIAIRPACREAGISPTTAYRIEGEMKARGTLATGRPTGPQRRVRTIEDDDVPGPVPLDRLSTSAQRALEDFSFFRKRYFGRITVPWQEDAIRRMEGYRESPHKEYVVLNVAPGSGKTSAFCHDYVSWLIVRDRRIRIMIGSRAFKLSSKSVNRVRRSLTRQSLAAPPDSDLRRGLAVMPEGILVEDYGRFAPKARGDEQWTTGSFVVAQWDDETVTDKEATVEAFGFDAEFLGNRFPLVIWDDLVSKDNIRSEDARAKLVEDYEQEAETRLEPGGLFLLQGQRRAAGDLYRHCLNRMVPVWADDPDAAALLTKGVDRPEIDGTADQEQSTPPNPWLAPAGQTMHADRDAFFALDGRGDGVIGYVPEYHHIVYPAHAEDRCVGAHRMADPPFDPADPTSPGCLLDPMRLPWRDLLRYQQKQQTYRVVYQQEDVDKERVLVQQVWVDGGIDPETGEDFPGCYDPMRPVARRGDPDSLPREAPPSAKSVLSLDPSASRFWALGWWLWDEQTEVHWLLDAARRPMGAPDMLDWNNATQRFSGLFEDYWQTSVDLGRPIRHLIMEVNACQKWLMQYEHAKRWKQLRGVTFVPHTTGLNKANPEIGVDALQPHWKYGRVRLPGHPTLGKPVAALLVNEATVYPDGMTNDMVMEHWFLVHRAPTLFPKRAATSPRLRRPSWLRPADQNEGHPLFARLVGSR